MFVKIKTNKDLYCINTKKIAFITYKKLHDKTEIVFKDRVLCEANGKKIYDFLTDLLAEDFELDIQA